MKTSKAIINAFGEQKTFSEWAQDPRCQCNYNLFYGRIVNGWSAEKALSTPARQNNTGRIEAFGETKTLSDWAKDPRCCVKYHTLFGRIKLGWDIEKALTTVARPMVSLQERLNTCEL